MDRESNKKASFGTIISALTLVILLAYFAIYKGVTKDHSGVQPYKYAELISRAKGAPISERRYAYADARQPGRFVFLENEGKPLSLRIRLHESAPIVVTSNVYYQPNKCSATGKDRAHLTLSSPFVQNIDLMITGRTETVEFKGYANSLLNVKLKNEVQAGCGLVSIEFAEKNRVRDFPVAFLLVWSIFILLSARFKLPTSVPVIGVSVNTLLVLISDTIGINNALELFATTFASLALCGVMLLVFGLTSYRWLRTLLLFLALFTASIIPTIFGGHYLAFKSAPTTDAFHAILQSHLNQAIEFWTNELGWTYILATLLCIVLATCLIFITTKRRVSRLACLGFGALLIAISVRDFPTYVDMHPMIHTPAAAVTSYFHELSAFQKLQDSRSAGTDQVRATSNQKDSNLLVVIGESANKWHMSSYGYSRDTTPVTDRLIESGEMLRFNAAYSNHIYSNPTVSLALTEADNYNGLKWSGTPSVMNVANAAGIHTTWVSNKLKLGPWDSVMSVVGDDASETIHINKKVGANLVSKHFDAELLPLVAQALSRPYPQKAIFVHLQGSHVEYASRYPDTHKSFHQPAKPIKFGKAIQHPRFRHDILNYYDNSLYYTDSVLGELMQQLKAESKPTALLYFADHGESVFRRHSHNAAKFEYEMAEIPLLFWANAAWKQANPVRWANLSANLNQVFTNDHIFDTVLGLLEIQSTHTHPRNDLSSASYEAEKNPVTLHGKKTINATDNFSYWSHYNLLWLQKQYSEIELSAKASSVMQAKQAFFQGMQKVYLSVFSNSENQLVMRGDKNRTFKVEDFLSEFTQAQQQRLVLVAEPTANISTLPDELRETYPTVGILTNEQPSTTLDLSTQYSYQDRQLSEVLISQSLSGKTELILDYKSVYSF